MKPCETPTGGPYSSCSPDAVSHLMVRLIERLSVSIGRIDPRQRETTWGVLADAFGSPLGKVSVHTTPNGESSCIDLMFHGIPENIQLQLHPLVFTSLNGTQFQGMWQKHTQMCRFIVPKDRRLSLQMSTSAPTPVINVQRHIHALTQDQMEQIEDCLSGVYARKGKRRN